MPNGPGSSGLGLPRGKKAWAVGTPSFGQVWAPPMSWDPLGLFILQLVYIPRGYPKASKKKRNPQHNRQPEAITEGIFECAKKVTTSAKNAPKNTIFASTAFLVRNGEELSRNAG
ncbi:hypothetical protein B0H19DRAFT_1077481 [Mycena capillaripes]|nr:hypothetical protein B0H19DRAFT_1077481 [Mycena capillaripes]